MLSTYQHRCSLVTSSRRLLTSSTTCHCIHWGHTTALPHWSLSFSAHRNAQQNCPSGAANLAPPTQTNHSRSHRRRRPLSHTLTDRPAAHPRDGTLTRAPLWPPIPCTSPTARRSDVGGGGTQPRHAASSTAAFSGLPRARLRGRDGPCPALHVRTRRLGRSLRTAQPSRSTSTQRAPPALTAAVSAPPPCRSPREFVRRRPRLHPGLATGAPGRRRRRRPSGREGSGTDGSGPPRAPLPIVPPRRHHARTLGEGRFT